MQPCRSLHPYDKPQIMTQVLFGSLSPARRWSSGSRSEPNGRLRSEPIARLRHNMTRFLLASIQHRSALNVSKLQIPALEIWVHGRQFPTAQDPRSSNRLHVTGAGAAGAQAGLCICAGRCGAGLAGCGGVGLPGRRPHCRRTCDCHHHRAAARCARGSVVEQMQEMARLIGAQAAEFARRKSARRT